MIMMTIMVIIILAKAAQSHFACTEWLRPQILIPLHRTGFIWGHHGDYFTAALDAQSYFISPSCRGETQSDPLN